MRCDHTRVFPAIIEVILLFAHCHHINAVRFPLKSVNWGDKHLPPLHKISLGRGNDGSGLVGSGDIAQESSREPKKKPDYDYNYDYDNHYYDDDSESDLREEYETGK